jgi:hypothetical protein
MFAKQVNQRFIVAEFSFARTTEMPFTVPLISLPKFANKGGQIAAFANGENSDSKEVVLGDYAGLIKETNSSRCPNLGQVHGTNR